MIANLIAFAVHAAPARVIVGVNEPISSLDPFSLTGIGAYSATGNVIEPLVRLDPYTQKFIPWLAERWTVDKVKNSFRVKLRKGVKFHNGENLKAGDVKFTLEAYYDPKFKGEIWQGMWANIDKVTVVDDLTVDFHMRELKYETFKHVMTTLRILPRSVYEKSEKKQRDRMLVGTGPFKVIRFDDRSLEIEPFKDWWGEQRPDFQLVYKTIEDWTLAEAMFKKGELDFTKVPADAAFAGSQETTKLPSATGTGIWIDLNLKHPRLSDLRVRRLLAQLWDRATLNKKIYGGQMELAVDSFSPKMAFYPRGEPPVYNPKKAAALVKDTGGPFGFVLLVHSAAIERWATLFQADAAKIGITVTLKRQELGAERWKVLHEGKFAAAAQSDPVSTEVHSATWSSKGEYNFVGFSDKAVDKALEELEREFDPGKRVALQRRLIERVRAQAPQVPGLFSPFQHYLIAKRLEVDPRFPEQPWKWKKAPAPISWLPSVE